jgi:hypothetical protein
MLAGYLDRRSATLSPEQVQSAHDQVATALREHRTHGSRRRA